MSSTDINNDYSLSWAFDSCDILDYLKEESSQGKFKEVNNILKEIIGSISNINDQVKHQFDFFVNTKSDEISNEEIIEDNENIIYIMRESIASFDEKLAKHIINFDPIV